DVDRQNGTDQRADRCEPLSHFLPRHAELAPRHVGKFIETLHTDNTAAFEQNLRRRCTRIGGKGIDQNIAVQELARHRTHRALASSRSNFQSAGSCLRNARMRSSARSRLRSRAMSKARSPATWTSTSSPSLSSSAWTADAGRRMARLFPHFET